MIDPSRLNDSFYTTGTGTGAVYLASSHLYQLPKRRELHVGIVSVIGAEKYELQGSAATRYSAYGKSRHGEGWVA